MTHANHPGRRKRRQIMEDLASRAAFAALIGKKSRLSYEERQTLEALDEVDSAYSGAANMRIATMAVMDTLDCKAKNTARTVIARVCARDLIKFEWASAGKCIKVPQATKNALKSLLLMERMIYKVILVEDGDMDFDIEIEKQALKDFKVYIDYTDDELDKRMRKRIDGLIDQDCDLDQNDGQAIAAE